MPYDEVLEARVRAILPSGINISGKKMFGGVGFMLDGHMACGVIGDSLIVRVGPERYERALREQHVKEFDMSGRPMRGWVEVKAVGIQEENQLRYWTMQGIDYAGTLAPK